MTVKSIVILTVKDVAALLKLHPEEVRERARSGRLPARKDGRRLIFIEHELLAHIEALPPANR